METSRPTWRSRAWVTIVIALGVVTVAFLLTGYDSPRSTMLAVAVAAVLVGIIAILALRRSHQCRLQYEDALAQWSADRAAQGERLRIARDLHDLASHGLGVITLRAAAAQSVTDDDQRLAEQAQALHDIENVSREATTELRRMLTVLREPGAAPPCVRSKASRISSGSLMMPASTGCRSSSTSTDELQLFLPACRSPCAH